MQTVQAVMDKIVVDILEVEKTTSGGLIIPDTAENEPQLRGRVISVGEDINSIEPGDVILCAKFGGQDIVIDRRVMKVLAYGEVYGILKEEE